MMRRRIIRIADRLSTGASTSRTLADYLQGPVVFISAALLLLVTRVYGALGGWEPGQVLALSLGMTASMLVCGGFVYAMSRRTSICLAMGDRRATRSFLRWTMVIAAVCVVMLAGLLEIIAGTASTISPAQRVTFGMAFLAMSVIWILASGLSLLRASSWLAGGLQAAPGRPIVYPTALGF
jgi:uncharacterized membrane protein